MKHKCLQFFSEISIGSSLTIVSPSLTIITPSIAILIATSSFFNTSTTLLIKNDFRSNLKGRYTKLGDGIIVFNFHMKRH